MALFYLKRHFTAEDAEDAEEFKNIGPVERSLRGKRMTRFCFVFFLCVLRVLCGLRVFCRF
jgi:hypothetical protein